MSEYYPPEFESDKFHCMHCKIYAHQRWSNMYVTGDHGHEVYHSISDNIEFINASEEVNIDDKPVKVSLCAKCERPTLWSAEEIIYPFIGAFPPVNEDLPNNVKEIYNEATCIANQSSRAACALLRLAVEMLLKHLGEIRENDSISKGIENLVKKGLDSQIQQALDIVRVTGNHAVHPGGIVFDDTTDVQALFDLVNIIAEEFITRPKRIERMYDNLPKKDKERIKRRDSKTQ